MGMQYCTMLDFIACKGCKHQLESAALETAGLYHSCLVALNWVCSTTLYLQVFLIMRLQANLPKQPTFMRASP